VNVKGLASAITQVHICQGFVFVHIQQTAVSLMSFTQ
jgi:hypothetical protein